MSWEYFTRLGNLHKAMSAYWNVAIITAQQAGCKPIPLSPTRKIKIDEIDYIKLTGGFAVPGYYSWAEMFDYFDEIEMCIRPEATEILKICDILKDLGYEYRSNTDEENERWGYALGTEKQLDYNMSQILPTYCSHP